MCDNNSLIINTDWCKGCGICVEFCPKKVLSLSKGKVVAEKKEDCILCGQCELRCPDNAIFIGGKCDE